MTVTARKHEAGGGRTVLQRGSAQMGAVRAAARTGKGFPGSGYSMPLGNAAAYSRETNLFVPLDCTAAGLNTPVAKVSIIQSEPAP